MRIKRDPTEFREQMVVEIRHLRRSAKYFDAGDETEGQRLALSIRKLVYDNGRNSVSLLTHLDAKSSLRFVDTALRRPHGFPEGGFMLHAGLATMRFVTGPGGGTRFAAPLDRLSPERRHEPIKFDAWWSSTVVTDQESNAFSRSTFVLGVANQDGGAHIDARLGAAYAAITRAGSLGLQISDASGEMQHAGLSLALATVRQIAWEIEPSLLACCEALGIEFTDA